MGFFDQPYTIPEPQSVPAAGNPAPSYDPGSETVAEPQPVPVDENPAPSEDPGSVQPDEEPKHGRRRTGGRKPQGNTRPRKTVGVKLVEKILSAHALLDTPMIRTFMETVTGKTDDTTLTLAIIEGRGRRVAAPLIEANGINGQARRVRALTTGADGDRTLIRDVANALKTLMPDADDTNPGDNDMDMAVWIAETLDARPDLTALESLTR